MHCDRLCFCRDVDVPWRDGLASLCKTSGVGDVAGSSAISNPSTVPRSRAASRRPPPTLAPPTRVALSLRSCDDLARVPCPLHRHGVVTLEQRVSPSVCVRVSMASCSCQSHCVRRRRIRTTTAAAGARAHSRARTWPLDTLPPKDTRETSLTHAVGGVPWDNDPLRKIYAKLNVFANCSVTGDVNLRAN